MLSFLMAMTIASGSNTFWGDVGMGAYPGQSYKVAPNGLTYKPMFRIVADINVGNPNTYVFAKSAYYAEKPQPGVTTNKSQGQFDFTKRQYDFDLGLAHTILPQTELRFWAYSQSNINRGNDLNEPYGFKDGAVVAARHYLANTLWQGQWEGGYYLTKELADNDGNAYQPGLFGEATLSGPVGFGIQGFVGGRVIFEKRAGIQQVDTRLGLKHVSNKVNGNSDVILAFERDFGFQQTAELNRVLVEYRLPFQGY